MMYDILSIVNDTMESYTIDHPDKELHLYVSDEIFTGLCELDCMVWVADVGLVLFGASVTMVDSKDIFYCEVKDE